MEIKQREPEQDVEHEGGADGLGRHGEAGVGSLDAVRGEQAVADAGTSGRAAGDDMGHRRGGQNDTDEFEEPGPSIGEQRPGEHARN